MDSQRVTNQLFFSAFSEATVLRPVIKRPWGVVVVCYIGLGVRISLEPRMEQEDMTSACTGLPFNPMYVGLRINVLGFIYNLTQTNHVGFLLFFPRARSSQSAYNWVLTSCQPYN